MCVWEPRGGEMEGGWCVSLRLLSFLICLSPLTKQNTEYGYLAGTMATLETRYQFPKMAPLCFFYFIFFIFNQSEPDSLQPNTSFFDNLYLYFLLKKQNSVNWLIVWRTIFADSNANKTLDNKTLETIKQIIIKSKQTIETLQTSHFE